jgi:hypothetical protein
MDNCKPAKLQDCKTAELQNFFQGLHFFFSIIIPTFISLIIP